MARKEPVMEGMEGFEDAVEDAIETAQSPLMSFLEDTLSELPNVQLVHKGRTWRLNDPNLPRNAALAWLNGMVREFKSASKG